MRKTITCLFGLMFLVSVITIGCGDDDNPGTPQIGTITIDPEPNEINAPWQITGPGDFNESGTGDMTLEDVAVGDYSLTWGEVPGWIAPSSISVMRALSANATLQFTGTYIDRFPFPDTADRLMTNFKNAYAEMNIDEYSNALHPDFIFVFADGSYVAPPSGIYTREEDLQSTTNMFNGEQGMDPDGEPRPGVREIEFSELTRLTVWEDVPETDIYFPGAIRALFDVRVVFYLNTEYMNTITVDSQQLFYLQSIDEAQDGGSNRTHYYMIGQQDLDGKLSVSPFASDENMSWSIVKVLYL